MSQLTYLPVDAPREEFKRVLDAAGALVCTGFLTDEQITRFRRELDDILDTTPNGRDPFSGFATKRAGALIARSSVVREIAVHPLLLDLCDHLLGPFGNGYQMHLTQAVAIAPGESPQILHRDRGLWGGFIPRRIETQLGTMLAVTEFTAENGATRVAPGSQHWDKDKQPTEDELCAATMPAGSILIYSGTVLHGGGANETDETRIGLLLHYCQNWLRQQENQYLSCPPEIAATLDPKLRGLIGYSQGSPVMGFFSSPTGEPGQETAPPEKLFGDHGGELSKRRSAEDVVRAPTAPTKP
ncbi:MAG: phytanoyl-CoA dioxygenase family protein [Pseudomonadota bacterium]